MRVSPSFKNDNFLRIRYVLNQDKPIVESRTIEKVQVGTWFFGLFPVYKYFYSEWTEDAMFEEGNAAMKKAYGDLPWRKK